MILKRFYGYRPKICFYCEKEIPLMDSSYLVRRADKPPRESFRWTPIGTCCEDCESKGNILNYDPYKGIPTDEQRVAMARDLNVAAAKGLAKAYDFSLSDEEADDVLLTALHKNRCQLAAAQMIDKQLGKESEEWLVERGMWAGIRWWVL